MYPSLSRLGPVEGSCCSLGANPPHALKRQRSSNESRAAAPNVVWKRVLTLGAILRGVGAILRRNGSIQWISKQQTQTKPKTYKCGEKEICASGQLASILVQIEEEVVGDVSAAFECRLVYRPHRRSRSRFEKRPELCISMLQHIIYADSRVVRPLVRQQLGHQ